MDAPLYERVAGVITERIDRGIYRVGDRLPSVRALCREQSVAINTVKEAYYRLEARGIVDARPRSGFFVRPRSRSVLKPPMRSEAFDARTATTSELWHQVHHDVHREELFPLGLFSLDHESIPVRPLSRMLGAIVRRDPDRTVCSVSVRGEESLRTAIARRYAAAGCLVSPSEVLIASGCTDGLFMALTALTSPGDAIVVEHPFFTSALQLWESLGLNLIEVPSDPVTGIDTDLLEQTFRHRSPAACVLVPTFNNPLGSEIPPENKRRIAQLAAETGIPVIEDDVFGDLPYDGIRRPTIKSFDTTGDVLLVSSVSKTIAPGYRTGWILPGKYQETIERLKSASTHAAATPVQLALGEFLASGQYDRHLRGVRRRYARNLAEMVETVERTFPRGTAVNVPKGGLVFWVELPDGVDSTTLYVRARDAGIAITPGTIFTLAGQLKNAMRLSCARWNPEVQRRLEHLGSLI